MGIAHIDNLFQPRSIAVVGASERQGSIGRAVMDNLIAGGFDGPIHAVNARRSSILGHKACQDLHHIEAPVDLVVVATPLETAPAIVRECVDLNVSAAVIISAGGKEIGEPGRRLEKKIQTAAAGSGLRIVGPNCLGVMCSASKLNASFAARMPLPGKLAFISQSGAICAAILDYSIKEQIGFSHFISLGSMLDVYFGDTLDYLGAQSGVSGIVMYAENLSRHRNFMSAARSVSRIKPVIVLKAGRTDAGAHAAASHTGAMAGEDAVCDAAFQRAGIVRVNTFEELFDAAEILSRKGRYRGPGLAILTNSGGPGVMAADALADYGLRPAALSPETSQALDGVLPAHWSHGNPVDIIGDASPERFAQTAAILLRAREVQALLVMMAPQALTDTAAVARTLAEMVGDTTMPVIACWMGGADVETGREILNRAGLATFDTPERAIRAFMNLHRHARGIEMLQQIPPRLSNRIKVDRKKAGRLIESGLAAGHGLLSEIASKALLSAYGIPTNPTAGAANADEAVAVADDLGYPVAMKILSPGIPHKSDAGGVLLEIDAPGAVRTGFQTIQNNARQYAPHAAIEGVSIQPMIDSAPFELIVGAKQDPDFGPVILFGMGGILAELIADRAIALPPLNRQLASRLMEATRVDRLVRGYRTIPPADREHLEEILIRLSQLVTDFPQITELDVNPLVIRQGQPLALDARVALEPATCPAPMHLCISPYPSQYESWLQLPDVGELFIRPIRPEDAPLLAALFDTLSAQSIYYRFFTPMKQLSPTMLARFTQIDYDREIALVAVTETGSAEKMLGAARVILQHNLKDAEFAVLVGDPWQGRGIGAHLLTKCLEIAKERGFGTIWGTVLAENKTMLALGKKLGFTIKPGEQSGEFDLTLDLSQLPST